MKHLLCSMFATLTVRAVDEKQAQLLDELTYGDGDSALIESIDDKRREAAKNLSRLFTSTNSSKDEFELVSENIDISPSMSSTVKHEGNVIIESAYTYTVILLASIYKNAKPTEKEIIAGKRILDEYAYSIADLFEDNEYQPNIWWLQSTSE